MNEVNPVITGGEAVGQILAVLLDDLTRNEAGARASEDTEYLHNYRVAIRRARVVIGQFSEVLPAAAAAYFSSEFRWLGQSSSPLRDADTFIQEFERHLAWLPETVRPNARQFQDHLRFRRKLEHEKFVIVLSSPRYVLFIAYWRAFAAKGHTDWNIRAWALFEDIWSEKIWRLYRRMVRKGRLIGADSPAAVLHELRKDGKKLRYLIEFFDQISSKQETVKSSPPLRRLRRLQNILGAHQDYDVQSAAIMEFFEIQCKGEQASNNTSLALGILIGQLGARQALIREKFESCFKKFSRKRSKRKFRVLCAKPQAKPDTVT
ncbi:MAG: CHAD domain-containing protein [Alphaproteobacteria bacterium]